MNIIFLTSSSATLTAHTQTGRHLAETCRHLRRRYWGKLGTCRLPPGRAWPCVRFPENALSRPPGRRNHPIYPSAARKRAYSPNLPVRAQSLRVNAMRNHSLRAAGPRCRTSDDAAPHPPERRQRNEFMNEHYFLTQKYCNPIENSEHV